MRLLPSGAGREHGIPFIVCTNCGIKLAYPTLTLNQRVVGSSPTAPTNQINELDKVHSLRGLVRRLLGVLCPW
jgi:hypothetical protein